MRIKVGLVLLALIASLTTPFFSETAQAFSGYASAPQSVTQSAIAGGIRVSWSAPVDVDTGITGYRVQYSTTGSSDASWTTWTTTTGTTYTSDILGLSQVSTYVRVAALTNANANVGAYGYPWQTIYATSALRRDSSGNVTYDTGFGLSSLGGQASNTYANASFTRVKYRIDTTISGVAKFAETDFYKWSYGGATGSTSWTTEPTISGIAIPTVNSGQQWAVQANVSDLNVFSDNAAVTKYIGAVGRLEIWPWDYAQGVSGLAYPGAGNLYDSDDTPSFNNAYASFQVHDLTNSKPVFVWNRTAYTYTYTAEVGYGTNPGNQPDWTFCSEGGTQGSCPAPTSFKLRIYINPSITPLADSTPPTVSRVDARTLGKSGDTITVQSTELGTVFLVSQTVSVTDYNSIVNAASYLKSSVSISTASTNTTLTLGYQSDGLYNLYAVDLSNNVSTGILGTVRIDNTAPTASSIAVGSTGTYIQITSNETITNTLQVFGMFAASDSGSAITINSVGVTGKVATLGLSRAIPAGATVYFSYTPASGAAGGRIVDLAGNEMAAITTRSITNNSTSPITVTLTVPDPISKGVSITASVSVSVAGKVTFYMSGKRIAGCLNKVASGTTPITVTCTFKPALSARQTIAATLIPTLSAYPNTSSSVDRFILKRTITR